MLNKIIMNSQNIADVTQYNYSKNFGTSIRQLQEEAMDTENRSRDRSSDHSISNLNPGISKLVMDINKNLDDYAPPTTRSETDDDYDEDHYDENDSKILSKIPNWIKEIILFVIIYFIFSMGFVKKSIGYYIKYINPDSDGNVPFIGILIYGFLLIVTFMITKYFLGLY
ncbi:hypothetical protein Catovirus_2_217 [Catovirus CTV1]|uniref:Uncharacterized protein n=1 Tax=Catovirus CTV1 TaxID=1977631 RepID=A0A1V0SC85_9VIRU|nr:hypothetical protein Catovirus_2_217 [Catovirus CTV1]